MSATEEYFGELSRRGHEPLLEKVTGMVRFDLATGPRTEYWLVSVERGDVVVSRGAATPAGCVLRTSRTLFDQMVNGEVNAMAAVLRGAVVIEGDLELMILLQRLFPGPPSDYFGRSLAASGGRRS